MWPASYICGVFRSIAGRKAESNKFATTIKLDSRKLPPCEPVADASSLFFLRGFLYIVNVINEKNVCPLTGAHYIQRSYYLNIDIVFSKNGTRNR